MGSRSVTQKPQLIRYNWAQFIASFYATLLYFDVKRMAFSLQKNEILKHVDFASEWRESCFRGLEFFTIFRGRMPPDPLQGGRRRQPPFIKPPLLKTCIRLTALASYTGVPFFNPV